MLGLPSFEVQDEFEVNFPFFLDEDDAGYEPEKVLDASVDGERLLSVKTDEGFEGGFVLVGDLWLCFLDAAAPLCLATALLV